MGHKQRFGRKVHGILLLDKPKGLTSNQVLQQVKSIYQAQKAGHTGSLDPLATGMLPVCFGQATKFAAHLLNTDKTYEVEIKLGERTTTGDSEGEIVATNKVPQLSRAYLEQVCQPFRGSYAQIPPMFSAIKVKGQRLHQLARQGITIKRAPRQVSIYQLDILDYRDSALKLCVTCSKGTYIRSLAEDIGEAMGCGAHVSVLRRLAIKGYSSDGMVTFQKLEILFKEFGLAGLDQCLLPVATALSHWPEMILSASTVRDVQYGRTVNPVVKQAEGYVRLFSENNQFIGLGEVLADGQVAPRRLMQVE